MCRKMRMGKRANERCLKNERADSGGFRLVVTRNPCHESCCVHLWDCLERIGSKVVDRRGIKPVASRGARQRLAFSLSFWVGGRAAFEESVVRTGGQRVNEWPLSPLSSYETVDDQLPKLLRISYQLSSKRWTLSRCSSLYAYTTKTRWFTYFAS